MITVGVVTVGVVTVEADTMIVLITCIAGFALLLETS